MELSDWTDVYELTKMLGLHCIKANLYRKGNSFFHFNRKDTKLINKFDKTGSDPKWKINGGYMFLDEENGTSGMVRLYIGDEDPKFSFWMEDGVIKADMA